MERSSTNINPAIKAELPRLKGIVKLFEPFVEGVMHDLESETIVAIYNNLSKRKAGEPSAISKFVGDQTDKFPDIFSPYYKTNWDGARFKCTSFTIRDEQGKAVGLMCVNFNTQPFQAVSSGIEKLLAIADQNTPNPVEQFSQDWRDRVMQCIDNYLTENGLTIVSLTTAQKSNLINRLYKHGLFHYRHAVPFIGKQLGLSKATIYKYLKEEKEQ